jgi:hypothetical protein
MRNEKMIRVTKKRAIAFRSNVKLARFLWGDLSRGSLQSLKELTKKYGFSVAAGDLQLLDGRWYVTNAGLLRVAQRRRCAGIRTAVDRLLSDPKSDRWIFKATVYTSLSSRGFVGYGDADPSNVSPLVRGAVMRMAETRAVSRALRKAFGVPICSVEELKYLSSPFEGATHNGPATTHPNGQDPGTSQPRLRDKLCILIRKYELDPNLVKRYAADFCGTETLREASRDLVEAFVSTVAKEAATDREALICKLNSYCQPEEVRP